MNRPGTSIWLRPLAVAMALAASAAPSTAAAESRDICVFDPAGKSGDYYALMSDFALEASSWGVEVAIKAYTDEETAAKDYEAGQCDGVVATGVRLQRFNNFPTTIEAMGALPDYDLLKSMVTTLTTSAGASKKLTAGEHTTVGFIPVGAVYLFVRDREVDTVGELAGKRIATMDYDKASPVMVDRVGGIVVPADLGSIGPKFNNGDVDACYVSAPAYRPFELYRGLEGSGGVLRSPLAQATLQVMLRSPRFPDGFVGKARTDLLGRFDAALALIKKAEADIPAKYWVDIPPDRQEAWDELFLATRVELRDKHGAYDPMMLKVARQKRCDKNGARSECAENRE